MGYFVTVDGLFVSDRHKLRESPVYARYIHHPSAVRTTVNTMKQKGIHGDFRVFQWKSKTDVTEEVLKNGS